MGAKKRRVALVLGGGGARGIAHIGAIGELERRGFEIAAVAGTSMGALVGGMYAAGHLEPFREWMCALDRYKVFSLVDFAFSSEGLVKGDRVIAAACLLRLSDTTGVGRDLGTRHRAGLGVSEISDAKVFIVSEETGIISMAEGGRLVRHLDEASLRQILHGIYDAQDKDARVPLLHFKQRRKGAHDEQQADKKA